MDLELDLSEFCCLNKDCPDYGKKGKGNIRVKERYESKNRALLRCNSLSARLSSNIIFFAFILTTIPRSSAAVGTSYGQCNLSSLRHEIPHSSAVGSFISQYFCQMSSPFVFSSLQGLSNNYVTNNQCKMGNKSRLQKLLKSKKT